MDEPRNRHIVTFGALMLMLAGAFNVLDGIVALTNPDYLHNDLLVSNLTGWGWFAVVCGVLQALTGFAVLRGSVIALWPGIVLAGVNALAQLANVAQSPIWSLVIIAADGLVIYGFAARGLELGVVEAEPAGDGRIESRV
jgi:hypothetical protein